MSSDQTTLAAPTPTYGIGLDRIAAHLPPELSHRLMIRLLPWLLPPHCIGPPWWRCSMTWDTIRRVPWLLMPIALPWALIRACIDIRR